VNKEAGLERATAILKVQAGMQGHGPYWLKESPTKVEANTAEKVSSS
jgi:hypothetical protein